MYDQRIVVVAAHPDDETIGLGGQLASMQDVFLVHVTDGAPRSRPDWKSYKEARRAELLAAAAIAGIPEDRCLEIGIPDQEAARRLVELSCHLSRLFAELQPSIVFTHPYEGGHPDHDACAFAVHYAEYPAELWEFASYHRSPLSAEIESGCFLSEAATRAGEPALQPASAWVQGKAGKNAGLPPGVAAPHVLKLTEEQRQQKQRMLDCFSTQRDTLGWFRVDDECIRRAPAYDFCEPAHAGRLFYESYDWGVSPSEWLRLARRADRMIAPCLSR